MKMAEEFADIQFEEDVLDQAVAEENGADKSDDSQTLEEPINEVEVQIDAQADTGRITTVALYNQREEINSFEHELIIEESTLLIWLKRLIFFCCAIVTLIQVCLHQAPEWELYYAGKNQISNWEAKKVDKVDKKLCYSMHTSNVAPSTDQSSSSRKF